MQTTTVADRVTADTAWMRPLIGRDTTFIPNTAQVRCAETLRTLCEPYNLVVPGGHVADAVIFGDAHLSVLLASELSTFDHDGLTRLVLAGHANSVRVTVRPWRPHLDVDNGRRRTAVRQHIADDLGWDDPDELDVDAIEVVLHARDPHGTGPYDRHPDLDELARRIIGAA